MHPKYKYHKSESPKIVHSHEEEKELGKSWKDSPAEFGIETHPGKIPDKEIAAKLLLKEEVEPEEEEIEKSNKKGKK